jgi:hypothetical protein
MTLKPFAAEHLYEIISMTAAHRSDSAPAIFSAAGFAVQCCLRVCRCLRGERHLRAVPSNSPHPGPSINARKTSDLDWPQPAKSILQHPPHPGPSINARKTYNLDWQHATESLLLHPAHPGPSINVRKTSDLDTDGDEKTPI